MELSVRLLSPHQHLRMKRSALAILVFFSFVFTSEIERGVLKWNFNGSEFDFEVVMMPSNQTILLNPKSHSLFIQVIYDFNQRFIIYKDLRNYECFVERMTYNLTFENSKPSVGGFDQVPKDFMAIKRSKSKLLEPWCHEFDLYDLLGIPAEWSKQRVKRSKRNTPTGPNSDSWFHQRPGRSFGQSQSQFIRTQPCNGPHCSPQDHASAKSSSENAEAVVVVGPGGMGQAQSQYMPAQDYFSWGRRDSHRHGAPGKSGGLAHQNGQSGHQRAPPNHPRIQAPVGPPRRYQNQRPRPDGHRQGIPGSPGGLLKRGHHESLGNVPRTMFGHSRVKTTGQRNPNGNLERRRRLGSRRRSMFGRDSHSYGAPGTVGGFVSEGDSSQSESQVKVGSSQTMASASTNGAYGMRSTQSQVQGGFSGAGSFSGQSQSMGGWGQSSSSGITADKNGVSSQAGTSFQSNQGSQSQVQFTNTGEGMASSQTRYNNGGSSTSLHASGSGGLAGAQASGIGLTTSQAQIGFKAQGVTMRNRDSGFVGGGQAASQSQGTYGQSQSQLYGSFMDGVAFSGGAQAGSKTIDQRQSLDQNLNQESRGHTRKFHPDDKNANVANGQRDEKPFESHVDSDHSMQRRLPYGNYDGNQRTFMRDRQDNGVPLDDSTTSTSRGTAVQTQEAPFNGDSNHFYSRRQKSQSRSNVYEAGEEVPGFPGYRVPNGFRAKVSTSHAPETSSLVFGNGQSQSQTININKAHLRSNEINKQNNINEEQETQISQPSEYYDYDYTEGDDDYYYYDDSYPTTPTYLTSTTTIVAPTFHRQKDMTDVQEGNGGVLPTQSPQYPDSAPPLSTENPNLTSETQQRGSQEGYVHGYRCRDNTNHLSPCAIFPWSGSLNIQGEGSWRLMPESSDRSSTGSPGTSATTWQQKYYTRSSTCGYFTFSCNIVFGTNRRTKICKPNPTQC